MFRISSLGAVAAVLGCAYSGSAATQVHVHSPAPASEVRAPVGSDAGVRTYQPWREAEPIDWRQANEQVERIGGWRAYLREVEESSRSSGPSIDSPAGGSAAPGRPGANSPPRMPDSSQGMHQGQGSRGLK